MPQETLERAVRDAVATALDPAVLEAAIDRAMELVEERREATRQRRTAIEDALRSLGTEEGRLIEAVKQGQGLDTLVTALHATQARRQALERELTTLDSPSRELADRQRLRAALTRRAADLHGILIRREPEARRVLQALFNERLAFTPFNEGSTRGYQFFGTGSYGGLLVGDTCPTSHGGPNGIRCLLERTTSRAYSSRLSLTDETSGRKHLWWGRFDRTTSVGRNPGWRLPKFSRSLRSCAQWRKQLSHQPFMLLDDALTDAERASLAEVYRSKRCVRRRFSKVEHLKARPAGGRVDSNEHKVKLDP